MVIHSLTPKTQTPPAVEQQNISAFSDPSKPNKPKPWWLARMDGAGRLMMPTWDFLNSYQFHIHRWTTQCLSGSFLASLSNFRRHNSTLEKHPGQIGLLNDWKELKPYICNIAKNMLKTCCNNCNSWWCGSTWIQFFSQFPERNQHISLQQPSSILKQVKSSVSASIKTHSLISSSRFVGVDNDGAEFTSNRKSLQQRGRDPGINSQDWDCCWWKKSHSQPPFGCITKPCKSWDKRIKSSINSIVRMYVFSQIGVKTLAPLFLIQDKVKA